MLISCIGKPFTALANDGGQSFTASKDDGDSSIDKLAESGSDANVT
jgi:hypothetical protein